MIAVVRIRGTVNARKQSETTLRMLGLKRPNTLALLPETTTTKGMIRKVDDFVAWGEASDELLKKLGADKKVFHLKPPRKGFKSARLPWPRGDLGYRGGEIEKLIERMI
ncbi:MAG: uL30 family ribosomal protein [Candidatus Aenigmarchaeota archaeon]|nr:uL30 family ribosomal protein [Candidatus Aenigmarchaeota archaeon]